MFIRDLIHLVVRLQFITLLKLHNSKGWIPFAARRQILSGGYEIDRITQSTAF